MASSLQTNREILSVADLNRAARRLLEGEFAMVFVEGEISNLAKPSSGHWYFTLKDSDAQLRCAMFRNRNQLVRFTPSNGQQIVVRGKISLYEGRGEYQMIAEHLEEAGDGALRRAFDQLKAKLQTEGLFDAASKQPLPAMPGHLGIITSPTGAAIRDVLQVLARRFPAIRVTILPVAVQGEDSPAQIVAALARANALADDPFDLLLLTRGGGSLEDLWSFNTEPVARAIAASRLPIVCAVGHETDVSIADFVADTRAPTPSAAAEIISPDGAEWLQTFQRYENTLSRLTRHTVEQQQRHLSHLSNRLRHPGHRLQDLNQRLDGLELRLRGSLRQQLGQFRLNEFDTRLLRSLQHQLDRSRSRLTLATSRLTSPAAELIAQQKHLQQLAVRLRRQMQQQLQSTRQALSTHAEQLQLVSPLGTLQRGYAIVSQTMGTGIVRDAKTLSPGDTVSTRLMHGHFEATVTHIHPEDLVDDD